jgi:FMN phosphatase YigB (HAD superfamily)
MPGKDIRALLFDVFGTVVDWRSSIIHELEAVGAHFGIDADWVAFADAWRGLYQPSMDASSTTCTTRACLRCSSVSASTG